MRLVTVIAALVAVASIAGAEDAKILSAPQLIATVKAAKPKGGMLIRVRMEQRKADGKSTVLAQIKRRETSDGYTEQLFQVTFPKERKGEALWLRTKAGAAFSAKSFTPGKGFTKLTADDKRSPIFGTDLTLEDLLADFLEWTKHETIGQAKVHSGECSIIESSPPRAGSSPSKVKSWIDNTRYIAWRVQLFDGGNEPTREVEAEDVMKAPSGYWFPRTFSVSTKANGTKTTVAGTSSEEGKDFQDADFSEAAIASFAAAGAK